MIPAQLFAMLFCETMTMLRRSEGSQLDVGIHVEDCSGPDNFDVIRDLRLVKIIDHLSSPLALIM